MKYTIKSIQIIEAAKKLFAEKGFNAVTTKEIAKEAKVNEVTIFRHFAHKDKLFDKILEYSISEPNFEQYLNEEEERIENYLISLGLLLQNIFVENIHLLKIEFFERFMAKDKTVVSQIPNQLKFHLINYLTKKHNMGVEEASVFALSYMNALHGLCMNTYVLDIFQPKPEFEANLAFLVEKYC